jgi:LacI family transcriptional regulator
VSATQKSIALELGVSRQLVGFALNNQPGVSAETRERVLSMAKRLGYDAFANRDARALIGKRYGRRALTGIVAILLPPKFEVPLRDVPYFSHTLDAMEREADCRGLDVLFCRLRNGQLPRLIESKYVDGVACVSAGPDVIKKLTKLEMPIVNVGRQTPGICWLSPDDKQGIFLTTQHLITLGHRRIAYLGHTTKVKNASERLAGFSQALKAAGLSADTSLIEATATEISFEAGTSAMERLLKRDESFQRKGKPSFTALVAYNDVLGIGAMKYLQDHGVSIPGDVSITGFDDVSSLYAFKPRLTSVAYSRADMGTRAISLLCESNGEILAPAGQRLPVSLVVHESSSAPSRS